MDELLKLYKNAKSEVSKIEWTEHHPFYPDSIYQLMKALGESSLIFSDYRKYKLPDVIAELDNANFEQIQCAVTFIVRSERWVTGSWKKYLEDGRLEKLLVQASIVSFKNV
ncbi:DUF6508 domain-containing protein [Marinomonas sp.]|uniref:DUF6508 domain-containing protein n=1 Tax=Marinomonas sp. TaxID=1904862 RepID=UPI003BAD5BEA